MYRNSAAFAGLEGGFPVEWGSIAALAAATLGPARRAAAIRPARAVRVSD
ncbi:hypothetical protein [Streptomyces sp. NPDC085529]